MNNSYYVYNSEGFIWRKDINEKRPEIWKKILLSELFGRSMGVSEALQSIIVNYEDKCLVAFAVKTDQRLKNGKKVPRTIVDVEDQKGWSYSFGGFKLVEKMTSEVKRGLKQLATGFVNVEPNPKKGAKKLRSMSLGDEQELYGKDLELDSAADNEYLKSLDKIKVLNESIRDFTITGPRSDLTITARQGGALQIKQIDQENSKFVEVCHFDLKMGVGGKVESIACCQASTILAVHVYVDDDEKASSVHFLKLCLTKKQLTLKFVYELSDKFLKPLKCFAVYGYVGRRLIVSGFTSERRSRLLTIAYDQDKEFAYSLDNLELDTRANQPLKWSRCSYWMAAIDKSARFYKLFYNLG